MARFRFYTFGSPQAVILDVRQADLRELSDALEGRRFLQGMVAEIDGEDVECSVLIPISRIQMISEIDL